MTDNVENATFEILKNIQASIAQLRAETNERFDRLQASARKDRRNVSGLMMLLQSVSGDFEERIRDLDDRVSNLEDRAI